MIQTKLVVGRYLKLTPSPARPWQGATHAAAFEPVICPPLTIQESTRLNPGPGGIFKHLPGSHRQSAVVAGTNANKVHRNFKWLPWYVGDISETDLACDVLTGPMSGCLLVTYRRVGVTYCGHVGTTTVTATIPAQVNTDVKTLWNNFANAHPGDVIGGFNPVANTIPPHPPAQAGDAVGQTWGLFTTVGQYFAVQVWAQRSDANLFRIAAVHAVPTMGLAALQNI